MMQAEIPTYLSPLFLALSIIVFGIFVREVFRVYPEKKIFFILLVTWFIAQYLVGKLGFFLIGLGEIPPKIMFVIFPNFLFLFFLALSKWGGEVSRKFDIVTLIALQSFRIFVELILWKLAVNKLLPIEMSFEGRNFDILVGISAPLVAYLAAKKKISEKVIVAWNIAGLILVTNVVLIGMLSFPGIQLIHTSISNFVVSFFPFNLLPGVLVPIAYSLHIISLRKVLRKEE